MTFYAIWPYFVSLALLFALAASPLLSGADTPPTLVANRVANLDGLRGLLALSVVFHHAAIYHQFLADGSWAAAPSRFHTLLGQLGVALFLMITGFLFWGQVIVKEGRMDWVRFYVGRAFRIMPLYLLTIGLMLILVFSKTGLRMIDPPLELLKDIVAASMGGMLSIRDVNGLKGTDVLLAKVTWTLKLEWMFYASLLFTAVFARLRAFRIILPAGVIVAASVLVFLKVGINAQGGPPIYASLFGLGMLTAALKARFPTLDFSHGLWSLVVILSLATAILTSPSGFAVWPALLTGVVFFLIANGASLFGLLTSSPAKRLGDISFGIYLMQGLALAVVFWTPAARSLALSNPLLHWSLSLFAVVLLVALATVAHVLVERPGIALGRVALRVAGWEKLAARRPEIVRAEAAPQTGP